MRYTLLFFYLFLFCVSLVSAQKTYFYAGSQVIAVNDAGALDYMYRDRLGSDVASQSLPFGQVLLEESRFPFTGKEQDASGLTHFGARSYDADAARFTSVDAVSTEPPYQYVSNNPTYFVDPDGNERMKAVIAVNPNYWSDTALQKYESELSHAGYEVDFLEYDQMAFTYDMVDGFKDVDLLVVAEANTVNADKASRFLGNPPKGFYGEHAQVIFLLKWGESSSTGDFFKPSDYFWEEKDSLDNMLAATSPVPFQVGGPFLREDAGRLSPSFASPHIYAQHYSRSPRNREELLSFIANPDWAGLKIKTHGLYMHNLEGDIITYNYRRFYGNSYSDKPSQAIGCSQKSCSFGKLDLTLDDLNIMLDDMIDYAEKYPERATVSFKEVYDK